MTILSIDIETYSSIELKTSGVYKYVEAPDFEILLLSYALGDEPVQTIDLTKEKFPPFLKDALLNPNVIKSAYNANFERVCLSKYLDLHLPINQWRCSSVHALYLGLPGWLEGVALALNLEQQKDSAGKNLINYFSRPCKPTKANGGRTRNLPRHDPEKWQQFIAYNQQDVEVERAVRKALERYPMPESEWRLWFIDQEITDRGVRIDPVLVQHAIRCSELHREKLEAEAVKLTGLENPNSVAQLKEWFEKAEGLEIESLNKKAIPALMKEVESATAERVLELRQELAKTSIRKYQAMERVMGQDGRARGLLQFYGANRTGRWAGRLVQVQNLPRNNLPDLDLARKLLRVGDYKSLELLFESVPDTLSQLIRTAIIPDDGHRFIVADFSSIEARVVAWLAGEKWRMDVFNSHGKIYEASAAQMFRVPIESIDKGSPLRQKGKIAELALGYGGAVGALKAMGALEMGLTEDELPSLVKTWRAANPNITKFWWDVEAAAHAAVREKKITQMQYGLTFSYESGCLFITLPSGRRLAYPRPRIENDTRFNKPISTYEGIEQKLWKRLKTYGPKLVENIVQAVSRDCLATAIVRLHEAGYNIVFHVHDEVIAEMPNESGSVKEMCEIMSQPISWAPGLPLEADGFECEYYRKD
jgi:DNA polymerase